MDVLGITPILNVSSLADSFAWFERLGWRKCWEWGDPPRFGAVASGKCEIFLCQGAQGSRGGSQPRHVGSENTGGVWMTWWVNSPAEVDAVHARTVELGLTITWPPTDEEWNVREFHLVHPDGHTFRVSAGLSEEE